MVLKDHDLHQLDEERIRDLKERDPEALVNLSIRLLEDLKEARERLKQNLSKANCLYISNSPSGRHWELDNTTAMGDPADIVELCASCSFAASDT
jgi:hypothetical protein